ncbi:MAG: hypothetical protein H0U05_12685 [Actinobacteria bacterium]|nr:hypothetical protein [Actinomycetota bacterium]
MHTSSHRSVATAQLRVIEAHAGRRWDNPHRDDDPRAAKRRRNRDERGDCSDRASRNGRPRRADGRALRPVLLAVVRARDSPSRRSRSRRRAGPGDVSPALALGASLRSRARIGDDLHLHDCPAGGDRSPAQALVAPARCVGRRRSPGARSDSSVARGRGRTRHRRSRGAGHALTRATRAVLTLHYDHDLTQSQIAEHLGIPLGTVKTRTYHGLRALRRVLEERNVHA